MAVVEAAKPEGKTYKCMENMVDAQSEAIDWDNIPEQLKKSMLGASE